MNEKTSLDDTSLQKLGSRDLSVQIQAVSKSLGLFHFSNSKYICNFPRFFNFRLQAESKTQKMKHTLCDENEWRNGYVFLLMPLIFLFLHVFVGFVWERWCRGSLIVGQLCTSFGSVNMNGWGEWFFGSALVWEMRVRGCSAWILELWMRLLWNRSMYTLAL